MALEHSSSSIRVARADGVQQHPGRVVLARPRIHILLQLRPTGKAVIAGNGMLRVRKLESRGGGKGSQRAEPLDGRGVPLLGVAQQILGLFLEMFEVWVFG